LSGSLATSGLAQSHREQWLNSASTLAQKQVSMHYNLGSGALFAYFGDSIDLDIAKNVANAIHEWQTEQGPAAEVSVVVRDTGFKNSEAKLNLAETLRQFGIKELRSI